MQAFVSTFTKLKRAEAGRWRDWIESMIKTDISRIHAENKMKQLDCPTAAEKMAGKRELSPYGIQAGEGKPFITAWPPPLQVLQQRWHPGLRISQA